MSGVPSTPEPDHERKRLGPRQMICGACGHQFRGRLGDRCPVCRRYVGVRPGLPWQVRGRKWGTIVRALPATVVFVHRHPYDAFSCMKIRRRFRQAAESMRFALIMLLACWLLLVLLWTCLPARWFVGGLSDFSGSYWRYLRVLNAPGSVLRGRLPALLSSVMLLPAAPLVVFLLLGLPLVCLERLYLPLRGVKKLYFKDILSCFCFGYGSAAPWVLIPHYGLLSWLVLGTGFSAVGTAAALRVKLRHTLVPVALALCVLCAACYDILG